MFAQVLKIAHRASNRKVFLGMSSTPSKSRFFHMFLSPDLPPRSEENLGECGKESVNLSVSLGLVGWKVEL
jgi:hypothetical protein